MLVGLSFGYCVKDLIDKKVKARDVLVIITSTDFDITYSESWDDIFMHYAAPYGSNPIWQNVDPDIAFSVVDDLWHSGKIHQPRKFGPLPFWTQTPNRHHWLDTIISPKHMTEAEKEAWDHYKFISGLSQ